MDLTLHNLPRELEQALILRAANEKKSLEDAFVDAAAQNLGVASRTTGDSSPQAASPTASSTSGCLDCNQPDTSKTTYTVNEYGAIIVRPATTDAAGNPFPKRRDLSDLAGTWVEDPEFDSALEDQRRIDWELWQ